MRAHGLAFCAGWLAGVAAVAVTLAKRVEHMSGSVTGIIAHTITYARAHARVFWTQRDWHAAIWCSRALVGATAFRHLITDSQVECAACARQSIIYCILTDPMRVCLCVCVNLYVCFCVCRVTVSTATAVPLWEIRLARATGKNRQSMCRTYGALFAHARDSCAKFCEPRASERLRQCDCAGRNSRDVGGDGNAVGTGETMLHFIVHYLYNKTHVGRQQQQQQWGDFVPRSKQSRWQLVLQTLFAKVQSNLTLKENTHAHTHAESVST